MKNLFGLGFQFFYDKIAFCFTLKLWGSWMTAHAIRFFQGLTLLIANIFWETATILSEYRDGRKARFSVLWWCYQSEFLVYFERTLENLRDRSGFSKHLKNTVCNIRRPLQNQVRHDLQLHNRRMTMWHRVISVWSLPWVSKGADGPGTPWTLKFDILLLTF